MDLELLKVLAPYFTSIFGSLVAVVIAIYNNTARTKKIDSQLVSLDKKVGTVDTELVSLNKKVGTVDTELVSLNKKVETVDTEVTELKKNHFAHLGEYLKKLNAFLFRGKLMDDVEKADMDILADGVAGK